MYQVLIICGGTGGHLTPGIAMAEELTIRGHSCSLVVSKKKVDARLIEKYPGMDFVNAPGAPLAWHPLRLTRFLWTQVMAFVFAIKLLSRKKPDLIVGFGGFLTAGVALPAFLKGIPFVLHEANRVVGRSNRFLGRFASKIFLPEGVVAAGLPLEKVEFSGLPLRKEFVSMTRDTAREILGVESARKHRVSFPLPKEALLLFRCGATAPCRREARPRFAEVSHSQSHPWVDPLCAPSSPSRGLRI